jgi:rSAM/selenodomain-associated transferase 2
MGQALRRGAPIARNNRESPPMETRSKRLTIVVPCLDEAEGIGAALVALQPYRRAGHQVIVVDGGSRDGTAELARPYADRMIIGSASGRALQMNAGATLAEGKILLFLHADTRLPPEADRLILDGLARSGRHWGRFDVRLSGALPALRIVEGLMNLRSRLTGVATGDQAIFVARETFEAVGRYREIPLMEDIALSASLKRVGRPLCLRVPVVTSSRRWERDGVWRTTLFMWRLRAAYFFGADPRRLVRRYYPGHDHDA